jgi:hypothetical protein
VFLAVLIWSPILGNNDDKIFIVLIRRLQMIELGISRLFQRWVIATVTCGLVVIVLGQPIALVRANTACGLIIPHEHILIGQADAHDLEQHLADEAQCATGKSTSSDEQPFDLHGHKGRILNVIRIDQSGMGPFINWHPVVADLPTMTVVEAFRLLHFWLEQLRLIGSSVSIPPPKPPPKSA